MHRSRLNTHRTSIRSFSKGKALARYRVVLSFLGMLTCLIIFPFSSRADSLDLAFTSASATVQPGGTVDFFGVITNTTGSDLDSTELFLNFNGFDPTNLDVNQILGSTIFDLPNFTFSPSVDLFSVTIANGAPAGVYSLEVQLEDVNNDVSNVETVDVNVMSNNTVAEPSSGLLMLCGLFAFRCLAGLRRFSSN